MSNITVSVLCVHLLGIVYLHQSINRFCVSTQPCPGNSSQPILFCFSELVQCVPSEKRGIQRPMFAHFDQFVLDDDQPASPDRLRTATSGRVGEPASQLNKGDSLNNDNTLPTSSQPKAQLGRLVLIAFQRGHRGRLLPCVSQYGPKYGLLSSGWSGGRDSCGAPSPSASAGKEGKVSIPDD